MHPCNPLCVVTHRGDMRTASCNAWKAVSALARWLIHNRAQEIVKSNEDKAIKWKLCCSTAKDSLSPVTLSHTVWVCSLHAPWHHKHPTAAAGLQGAWGWLVMVWLCRIRAAHSDRSVLPLKCRRTAKKRHFWWNSWCNGDLLNQCCTAHAACSVCCC